jgi:eukaryotic-like serine/threonine-protein kinase
MDGSPGPVAIGRYRLYDKIAAGGMATVYLGRLQGEGGFSRTVAIKRLHPHLLDDEMFVHALLDEARLAARVQSPHVAQTLDVVSTDREFIVVMEYVRGESLSRLLRAEEEQDHQPPLPVLSSVIAGALQGLHAAHEALDDLGHPLAIVHRDVSPQNILVGIDGLGRVIDFGVAKAAGRLQTTRDGAIKGKVPYMSPEQIRGQRVTRTTDTYAMGVVLWEAITGRRLFRGDSDVVTIQQVLAGAQTPPSAFAGGIPPPVDAVVMRALDLEPSRRFATALEMADALSRAVPPALPAEVGAWCSAVATVALKRRAAAVAQMESQASAETRRPSNAHERQPADPAIDWQSARTLESPSHGAAPGDVASVQVAFEPSTVESRSTVSATGNLELGKRSVAPGAMPARKLLLGLGALAVLATVTTVLAFLLLRGSSSPSASKNQAQSEVVPTVSAPPPVTPAPVDAAPSPPPTTPAPVASVAPPVPPPPHSPPVERPPRPASPPPSRSRPCTYEPAVDPATGHRTYREVCPP